MPAKTSVVFLLIVILSFTAFESQARSPQLVLKSPASQISPHDKMDHYRDYLDSVKQRIVAQLQGDYEVRQGLMYFFKPEDCQRLIDYHGFCFGGNPSTTYGFMHIPHAEGEYHPADHDEPDSVLNLSGDDALKAYYRLRPDEAIVMVGLTPPEVKYYAFRSYLLSRHEQNYDPRPLGSMIQKVYASLDNGLTHLDPQRTALNAALGDSLNMISMQTRSNQAYLGETAMITTTNKILESDLREVLVNSGVSRRQINLDKVPASLGYLGHHKIADDFVNIVRVTKLQDTPALQDYFDNPPMLVLRVTPKESYDVANDDLHQQPDQAPRRAINEKPLYRAKRALEEAVKRYYGDRRTRGSVFYPLTIANGIKCIEKGYDCGFDNTDAAYSMPQLAPLTQFTEGFAVMVGVNHVQTRNATYGSVAFYDEATLDDVASIDHERRSQAHVIRDYINVLPDNYPGKRALKRYAHLFYVYKLSSQCTGLEKNCVPVNLPPMSRFANDITSKVVMLERIYIKPGTAHGPDYSKLLYPKMFYFD